eukprot:scaffold14848_cov151-Skeletonema_dohrnii-CCMP3373.AAC.1
MAQQQSIHEYEANDTPAGFQIVCCPIELKRSSSETPTTLPSSLSKTAPTLTKLPSTAEEDTHVPVQLSSNHTTSLQRPSSFLRSTSLHREPSLPINDAEAKR